MNNTKEKLGSTRAWKRVLPTPEEIIRPPMLRPGNRCCRWTQDGKPENFRHKWTSSPINCFRRRPTLIINLLGHVASGNMVNSEFRWDDAYDTRKPQNVLKMSHDRPSQTKALEGKGRSSSERSKHRPWSLKGSD